MKIKKFFQNLVHKICHDIFWESIKTFLLPFIFTIILMIRVALVKVETIDIILLVLGIISLFPMGVWLNKAKRKINKLFLVADYIMSIENKIKLGTFNIRTHPSNDDLLIYLMYPIYNYSLKAINGSLEKGTQWSIKIISDNDQTTYSEENTGYPKISPFLPFENGRVIQSNPIRIPFKERMTIRVKADFFMSYNDRDNKNYILEDKRTVSFSVTKQSDGIAITSFV